MKKPALNSGVGYNVLRPDITPFGLRKKMDKLYFRVFLSNGAGLNSAFVLDILKVSIRS